MTIQNDRAYNLAASLLDEDLNEYPASSYNLRPSSEFYGQDLAFSVPIKTEPYEQVRITGYRLYIDGFQFDHPLPYSGGELFAGKDGRMDMTITGPLIDGLTSLIEQVANS